MPTLLDPLPLRCDAALPNRLALAPLTNQQSHADGTLSDEELAWLERRAQGGFGLVSTCAAHVTRDGQGFDGELGVWGDHQLPGLARMASALHAHGAVSLVQLFHGGVRAPSRLTGLQPLSASEFVEDKPGFEVPRAATEQDIERIVSAFREAAQRSIQAGFHGVEIHGAHGYLLSQFLSRTQNLRTDAWGGDLAGRARLVRTITRQIREVLPAGAIVGVRLSPEDAGQARGLDLDESLTVARWLAEDGVDFVHASLWDWKRNTAKRPEQHPVPLLREVLPREVALVAAGNVWTRQDAEELLALGADVVSVGRAAILDPDWPRRVGRDGQEPVRPPRTVEQLAQVAISPGFVDYLRRFKGLVG
jgi:2,4-dienoyl-CoA reductase-like NADH-dependent reductase (Old Yellow Enzyme family)